MTEASSPTGPTTYFAYDDQGNQTRSWYIDVATGHINISETEYDDAGRVIASRQFIDESATGGTLRLLTESGTDYTAGGQTTRTTDAFGNVTEYTYDARGLLLQTRSQAEQTDPLTGITTTAWLITRTVYDANGRAAYATDSYVESDATSEGWGTHTVYDALGRVIRTERLKGLVIDLALSADGTGETTLADPGVMVSHSGSTTFDAAGRVSESVDEFGTITRYSYDALGRTIETRRQSRDEAGDPVWLVSRTAYDNLGRAFASSDTFVLPFDAAADAQADYAVPGSIQLYDDAGRMIGSQQVLGIQIEVATGAAVLLTPGDVLSTTQTIYDAQGRVARTIDLRGNATDYEYDAFGRQIAVIGPVQTIDGELQRHRTETEYDTMGRQHLVRDNIAVVVDATGAVLETRRDDARETITRYDAQGRPIEMIYADGTSTQTEYDDFGRRTASIDQLGRRTSYEYDAQGRLVAVELPEVADPQNGDAVTRPRYEYGYDAEGNQVLIRDPLGRVTSFAYDDRGQQVSRTLPLGNDANGAQADWTERFEYDDRGRRTLHISFEGRVRSWVYSDAPGASGRLVNERFWSNEADYLAGEPAEETWSYTYDAFDREVAFERTFANGSPSRLTTKAYDAYHRLVEIASPEGAIHYDYDAATGDQLRVWTADTETTYSYDAFGRLATVTSPTRFGAATTEAPSVYEYDLLGRLDALHYFNGVITDYVYDNLDRMVELTNYAPDATPETLTDNPIHSRFTYDLLADGSRGGVTETDQDGNVSTVTYSYDGLNRLIEEARDDADDRYDFTDTYTLDLASNRIGKTHDVGSDSVIDTITTYEVDANDRLLTATTDHQLDDAADRFTAYTWNATEDTGHVEYAGLDATGVVVESREQTYDLQGRLSYIKITDGAGDVTEVQYTYSYAPGNPHGLRVAQSTSVNGATPTVTTYLFDPQNMTGYEQVLEEHVDGAASKSYVVGYDVIAQAAADAATQAILALLYDAHGNTRQVTDAAGLIATIAQNAAAEAVKLLVYDVPGNAVNFTPATAVTGLLYTGDFQDAVTGQLYLRARWYDSATERFSTMDSWPGSIGEPVSYHRYLYGHANPVLNIDPTGEMKLVNVLVTTSVIGFLTGAIVGGIRGGAEGAVVGAVSGAIFAPVITVGTIGFGLSITAFTGISTVAGLATSFVLVTTASAAYNSYELLTAKNDRERYAAAVSLIFTVGFGIYGGVKFASIPKLPPNAAAPKVGILPNSKSGFGTFLSESAALLRGERVVGREVTIELEGGIRIRIDLIVRTITGRLKFIESKFGPTAEFTENQLKGFPLLAQKGGTSRGANGTTAGLPPGTKVGPTEVQVDTWSGANP